MLRRYEARADRIDLQNCHWLARRQSASHQLVGPLSVLVPGAPLAINPEDVEKVFRQTSWRDAFCRRRPAERRHLLQAFQDNTVEATLRRRAETLVRIFSPPTVHIPSLNATDLPTYRKVGFDMNRHDRILDAVAELTRLGGRPPSILDVARHVGLTKQGVLHYFPTRADLDHAVLMRAVDRVDATMRRAATAGPGNSPTATYLRLTAPEDADVAAAAVVLAAVPTQAAGLPSAVTDAFRRWEALIAAEVGDRVRAEVIRLTGDGLFAESLAAGTPPDPDRIERLITHLTSSQSGADMR